MRILLILTGISGFLSVAIGAFAAHGLKQYLSAAMLMTFQTGVHYQAIHTLAALASIILYVLFQNKWFLKSASFFLIGIVVFSGSLYVLTITGVKILGIVTPIGGVLLLVAWLMLVVAAFQLNPKQEEGFK